LPRVGERAELTIGVEARGDVIIGGDAAPRRHFRRTS